MSAVHLQRDGSIPIGISETLVLIPLLVMLAFLSRLAGGVAETPTIKPLPGNPPCAYPTEAQRNRIAGPVLYTALVRPDGRVEKVDIRRVPAAGIGFEEALRTCVSKWRFEAATGAGGLRQYEGVIHYRIAAADEVAVRALLEAFASAWNSKNTEALNALQSAAPGSEPARAGSLPSLSEQVAKDRAAGDWEMELEPAFQEILFLRPDAVVVRQPFRRRGGCRKGSPADGQASLLEATAIRRGGSWSLLAWYPVAGPPPSPGQWLIPGVEEPHKVKHVDPTYPDLAFQEGVSGVVVLQFVLDTSGHVEPESVVVLRGHPLLDDVAMDAVRKWEYTPTLIAGVPMPLAMTTSIEFQAKGRHVIVREGDASAFRSVLYR